MAQSLSISHGAVGATVVRAQAAGLDWAQVQALTDDALEARLYGRPRGRRRPAAARAGLRLPARRAPQARRHARAAPPRVPRAAPRRVPLHAVLRALPPLARAARPDDAPGPPGGREALRRLRRAEAQRASTPPRASAIAVELFVAVLGASNYTYAEATLTQQVPDWIASHQRAFAFIGGVPAAVVRDQLKSGVVVPCRYEPGLQRTYEELAQHYGTVILPARPAQARDKAKVEVAVQVVERWILARLRHETFFSLDALNERIAELLDDLNDRPMRLYRASRRELFERLDQPALRPLPGRAPSSTASGRRRASTSTTTSSSTATTTPSPTRSCTRPSTCAPA